MKPINLAFLSPRLTHGGAELQMIALTERLTKQGFRVDFVTLTGNGPLDQKAQAAGASVRPIGVVSDAETPRSIRYSRLVGRYLRWIAIARRQHYDIVDAWLHPPDVAAALTRPFTGVSVVMSARLGRGARMQFGPATQLVESTVGRLTDAVVANAEITATDARATPGLTADKVHVIRGGVEPLSAFTQDERTGQRSALGVTEGEFLVGCVANFRVMKRHDLLLDAFARLVPEHKRLRLVLVGDGDLRSAIERQIRDLGLERHVIVHGSAADTRPLFDSFDLLVQASDSEGLPNVLLEGAAAGLPIVATAAGGSGEVIRDGETGLLVPVDDADSLAEAMSTAIANADLRHRLGGAARRLIEREYGMDRFVREYAELYRRLLNDRRGWH